MANQKQKDLEAGKRRLEEFRKKKAADWAKKGTSANHDPKPGNGKQSSKVENDRFADIDGVGTSDGICRAVSNSNITTITNNEKNTTGFTHNGEPGALNGTNTSPPLSNNDFNPLSTYTVDINQKSKKIEVNDNYTDYHGNLDEFPRGTTTNQFLPQQLHGNHDFDSSISQSSSYAEDEAQEHKSDSSSIFDSKILPQNSGNKHLQNRHTYITASGSGITDWPLVEDYIQATRNVNISSNDVTHILHGNGGFSDSLAASGRFPSIYGDGMKYTNTPGSDARSASNHAPKFSANNESTPWISRTSFCDFLNTSRPSPGGLFQQMKLEKDSSITDGTKSNDLKLPGSTSSNEQLMGPESSLPSNFRNPKATSEFEGSESEPRCTEKMDATENRMDQKYELYPSKQNEDFAALEQHIEDLTQEKFSLQRALEASRTLTESLVTENSSLTDNYNQQRSVVNQLKSDMEQLQEEIKARLVELESLKPNVANAHLECNAADERAKLLASEVISLEEKALRLRSNELKLEKQLDNAEAEITSCRKKMSGLEKERINLQSTIDALQEEKKVMQYKLQKVSGTAMSVNLRKSQVSIKDVCTSTEDINANTNCEIQETRESNAVFTVDAYDSSLLIENVNHGLSYENIPSDQLRTIENINTLISELFLEKEVLLNTLTSESSQCSQLKELNKELSWKLEIQTQRLELLTAQSMTDGVVLAKLDSPTVQANAPYPDEGDEELCLTIARIRHAEIYESKLNDLANLTEAQRQRNHDSVSHLLQVVERVLGWIMKLFPGGPSRRRTSKLL